MWGLKNLLPVFLLVIHACATYGQSEGCAANWTRGDGIFSCYQVFTKPETYENAKAQCAQTGIPGSTLLTISSEEERSLVTETILKGRSIWLGLREEREPWRLIDDDIYLRDQGCYEDESMQFLTYGNTARDDDTCLNFCRSQGRRLSGVLYNGATAVDCGCGDSVDAVFSGAPSAVTCSSTDSSAKLVLRYVDGEAFNLWASQQPNHFGGMYQGCLAIRELDTIQFADETCLKRIGFMCALDRTEADCPADAAWLANFSTCAQPNAQLNDKRNWFQARATCIERGGSLLKPRSRAMLEDMISNPIIAELLESADVDYWIGGVSGVWRWENGDIPMYSGWIEEDNPSGDVIGRGQCAVREPSGVWKIKSCSAELQFACKYAFVEIAGELTIGNGIYNAELADATSEEYAELSSALNGHLEVICADVIDGCKVGNYRFTDGSIVAAFTVYVPEAEQDKLNDYADSICQAINDNLFYEGVECFSVKIGDITFTTTTTSTTTTTTTATTTTTTTTTTTPEPDTTTTTTSSSVMTTTTPTPTEPETNPPAEQNKDDDDTLDVGIIVAIVVVCVVLLLLTIRLCVYCCCGSKHSNEDTMERAVISKDKRNRQSNNKQSVSFANDDPTIKYQAYDGPGTLYDNADKYDTSRSAGSDDSGRKEPNRIDEEVALEF